jgi:hypothetical protein
MDAVLKAVLMLYLFFRRHKVYPSRRMSPLPVDGTLSTIESEKSRIVKAGIPLSCGFGNVNLKKNLRKNRNVPKIIVEFNGQTWLHPRFCSFIQTVGSKLR